ncbi:ferredoxin reductase family protein [Luteipulveratus sp. YIM 133132]|uniref:Ferredoxin reductase family protein n=1 Tax=Luteipulveratus flavus TaxID=3031728 RepID=A0ABT6CAV5_9MICO|nr:MULTISPECIES: ferredoxin reductase family protein [unclassified Luteipulveratus]MDE9365459.1 ferredoxin reductase family protein [Luteipulveratus sp. YIM 133132]MDF8266025.1 ferredoxin reductase family protein [Luteipulveratus sp. YIM 133296]
MTNATELVGAVGTFRRTRAQHRAALRTRSTWWRDGWAGSVWVSLLVVVALWVRGGGVEDLSGWASGLTSLGRLTGLLASDLLLVQVLLMARVPLIERTYGQDELARWHRWVGFASFDLMLVHIVTITLGYAGAEPDALWSTAVDLTLNYPAMLLAIAGTVALCLVVVTSVRAARRRLRYESWHLLHLYAYLGVGLALPHQLWTGQEFTSSPAATVYWWGLWALAAAAILTYRVGVPLWLSARHRLMVVGVRAENDTVTTVLMSGRRLDRLPVRAGQYFGWRFLDGPGWTRAKPFSLSAAPDGRTLRITAAHLGAGSSRLATLRPGTKVLLEGPYGRLHDGVRTRRRVVLMASGIGVTPMRALLEALPQLPGDVTLIYRAGTPEDLIMVDELQRLAAERGAQLVLMPGHRPSHRDSWLPDSWAHLSDADALRYLAPDVADADVFVCGSPAWMEMVRGAAHDAGVPRRQIHLERFSY